MLKLPIKSFIKNNLSINSLSFTNIFPIWGKLTLELSILKGKVHVSKVAKKSPEIIKHTSEGIITTWHIVL
jgi:hypothetical protein